VQTEDLTSREYQALAEFRYQIRRFLRFSERAAVAAGLEPRQHQLLLAVSGYPGSEGPTVSYLAERLQLRHHSVGGLLDRLVQRALVLRSADAADKRQVRIRLTPQGEQSLRELSLHHRNELQSAGRALVESLLPLTNCNHGEEGKQDRDR
jgi:DNA-binding MarR family transcriptional regulator